ncbi:MAG: glycosyltransferase [Nitrososphaeraceae archaeon]|nr:glycosyltransferase [Nitrososphaeraceae archaeon]
MKILHISHHGLPDWRIEKSAITAMKEGHRVFFAGELSTKPIYDSIFEKKYNIIFPNTNNYPKKLLIPYILLGRTSIWNSAKKQVKKILDELRPDIIHAHNLIAAKLISEYDIPMVYNDHEYWPVYIQRQLKSRLQNNKSIFKQKRDFLYKRLIKIWSKWEYEIVSKYPTFVVSQTILNELKKYSKKLFLLPNFPIQTETLDSQNPVFHTYLSSVYAGKESLKDNLAHRNIEGLEELFEQNNIGKLILLGRINNRLSKNIINKGFLPRDQMYKEMVQNSIGLLPMKKESSHKYINPNKAYEYAHGGLYVVCTSSFSEVINTFKNNCGIFDNYDELKEQLLYFQTNKEELFKKRVSSYKFAKENLIWELYEKNILDSYKII